MMHSLKKSHCCSFALTAKARVLYIHIEDESENKVLNELCCKYTLCYFFMVNSFKLTLACKIASLRNQMMEAGLLEIEKRPYKVSEAVHKAVNGAALHCTVANCRKLFLVDSYDPNQENRHQTETPH
jgi:hypothetical protein